MILRDLIKLAFPSHWTVDCESALRTPFPNEDQNPRTHSAVLNEAGDASVTHEQTIGKKLQTAQEKSNDEDRYPEVSDDEVEEIIKRQTPGQRLSYLFDTDFDGYECVEKKVLKVMPILVLFPVSFVFAYMKAPEYAEEFIRKHKATAWPTKMVAKRKYNDFVMTNAFRFGVSRGMKVAILSTSFFLIQCTIAAYNGKSTWWEMPVSSSTVGALYCMNRGLRGMVAGGLIGGVPGLVAGVGAHQLKLLTAMTYEDLNRKKITNYLKKKREIQEALKT